MKNGMMQYGLPVFFLLLWSRVVGQELPADKNATPATVALYNNMKLAAAEGYFFGHQDDLAYGVNWKYEKGRSDVREACGDYPAVYGWDFAGLEVESDHNINGIPFAEMRRFIQEGFERGGINTISWHATSPLGKPKGAWDTTYGTVAAILPGGSHHHQYRGWLNTLAFYIRTLKTKRGEPIPILFRPFHELTGNWFWWCGNTCTPEQFKQLWRFTFRYLTDEKKIHNLLWVYNTSSNITTEAFFLERYPGDDVVDVLSIDGYQSDEYQPEAEFISNMTVALDVMQKVAEERKKLSALAETGYEGVPDPEWWTTVLGKTIGDRKISYVMVWRNQGYIASSRKMHYYAPFKGQLSEQDFRKFYADDRSFFGSDAARRKLYRWEDE